MPPASHQVSATPIKLLIQEIHPHVRVERDSGMCVARDLYELWGRSPVFFVLCLGLLQKKHHKQVRKAPTKARHRKSVLLRLIYLKTCIIETYLP